MTYVRPSINDSDIGVTSAIVAVDTTETQTTENPYVNGEFAATQAGWGVRYRVTGDSDGADNATFDVEILDALPMRRADVQGIVGYDSDADKLSATTNEYESIA